MDDVNQVDQCNHFGMRMPNSWTPPHPGRLPIILLKNLPTLPAKTGTAMQLRPPALPPDSCCPPPYLEPLLDESADAVRAFMEQHDSLRISQPDNVLNRLVYDSLQPAAEDCSEEELESYLSGKEPYYTATSSQDTTLVFESRFESGNLRRAIQVYPYEYDLVLSPDLNTTRHTQWFFFSVGNTRKHVRYKFNIINLMKEDSLYSMGMQPLLYSTRKAATTGLGWHRGGDRVCYYSNQIKRKGGRMYYTLTFSVEFPHDHDTVYFAHCYPFTYTDLQYYLQDLKTAPQNQSILQRDVLCLSLAGNVVDVLTITAPCSSPASLKQRKGIFISGRVHPGETNASWMMKGLLDFLTGWTTEAQTLREHFVFKVIPMLNPDGVINGNYRCNLAGVDLNRVWNDPSPKLQPVIYHAKQLLQSFMEDFEVSLFCDLHGHSCKKNVFMYGCQKRGRDCYNASPNGPVPGSIGGLPGVASKLQEKLFPLLLYHTYPEAFSYMCCDFKVHKHKFGTGRVVGFRELGLVHSYTMEASFCGASSGPLKGSHFNTEHLECMGAALCVTLLRYWMAGDGGHQDMLQELEALHPAGGSSPSRIQGGDDDDDDGDGGSSDSADDSDDEYGRTGGQLRSCNRPSSSRRSRSVKKRLSGSGLASQRGDDDTDNMHTRRGSSTNISSIDGECSNDVLDAGGPAISSRSRTWTAGQSAAMRSAVLGASQSASKKGQQANPSISTAASMGRKPPNPPSSSKRRQKSTPLLSPYLEEQQHKAACRLQAALASLSASNATLPKIGNSHVPPPRPGSSRSSTTSLDQWGAPMSALRRVNEPPGSRRTSGVLGQPAPAVSPRGKQAGVSSGGTPGRRHGQGHLRMQHAGASRAWKVNQQLSGTAAAEAEHATNRLLKATGASSADSVPSAPAQNGGLRVEYLQPSACVQSGIATGQQVVKEAAPASPNFDSYIKRCLQVDRYLLGVLVSWSQDNQGPGQPPAFSSRNSSSSEMLLGLMDQGAVLTAEKSVDWVAH